MAEYIERGTAIAKLTALEVTKPSATMTDAKRLIADMPAVDVAPVVHCKDCAHRTEMGNCGHPRYHGILPSVYPYDFCSYGARMDGGADNETD